MFPAAKSGNGGSIAAFDEVADELAEAEARSPTPQCSARSDRLGSAKDAAAAALAMLRQWAEDAEANDRGEAGGR